jgi:glycosyltransferase involved in cell wall biosynthesis
MAKVFVHAATANAGGGVTYMTNVVPLLERLGRGHEWHVLAPRRLCDALAHVGGCVTLHSAEQLGASGGRLWFDQWTLRRHLTRERFDLIFAVGNFGLICPPVPQVLFSRNALYFSEHHARELLRRRRFKDWARVQLRRRLALASMRSSAINITPTAAFLGHILRYGRVDVSTFRAVHHGFDQQHFRVRGEELPEEYRRLMGPRDAAARVLFVSHYNYFRNFETVLRAVAQLKKRLGRPFQLVLTTMLGEGVWENQYDTTDAARLIDAIGIRPNVVMLGHVPYKDLYSVYRACDLAVCPSYAETFGHPMVEAMSSGLPLVATDMDVHREVCQEAAVYCRVLDPGALAEKIASVLEDRRLYEKLSAAGQARAACFSWERHLGEVLALIEDALGRRRPHAVRAPAEVMS